MKKLKIKLFRVFCVSTVSTVSTESVDSPIVQNAMGGKMYCFKSMALFCGFFLCLLSSFEVQAQNVKKPCSRIEGLYVPCGGGGGGIGCSCPQATSCDPNKPTFPHTCTSSYDGKKTDINCPYCCFEDSCDAVKDTMACNASTSFCGKSCKGTQARTGCSKQTCNTYKVSTMTRAVIETTQVCLKEVETEIFSCNSSASTDGCSCSCSKTGNGCQVSQTGTCTTPCSCGKVGQGVAVSCASYQTVCEKVETIKCKTIDKSIPKEAAPGCACGCPASFKPTPPEIMNLPNCGSSTSCTPGACVNC